MKKLSLMIIFFILFSIPSFAENVYKTQYHTMTTSYSANAPSSDNSPATTSTVSSLPESDLGLTNILNIMLIVIGLLLILLAIAILIRLKH